MEKAASVSLVKYLPNVVSTVRIVGAFILPFLMWESWSVRVTLPAVGVFTGVPVVWLIVYLVLVFTDKLDGTLARMVNAESEMGALLDVLGDAALLVVGVACTLGVFARESLSTAQFWFYVGIVVIILGSKGLVFFIAKARFGVGNMLHSMPHKIWAVIAYFAVAMWAFLRTIPAWSILGLLGLMAYAIIDEIIYLMRSAEYDVDFRGHGWQTYPTRAQTRGGV